MNTSTLDHNQTLSYEGDNRTSDTLNNKESLFDRLKKITSISEVLRLFGACAVIASMSLFLLNGWSDGNDIQRYLKLLGQTGLLTAAGIILSFVLKENKGARIFFGLSLISVVANFMILGALTYSMFQLDGSLTQYPSFVTWKAVSASTFWPIFAVAVTLLAVLTRFSFSIFSRNIAAPLSINFLLMCSLLLVPVRSSLIVSLLAIAALWCSALLVKKLSQNENVVFTNETKFALGLMFAPGLLIIARALSLYSVDAVMLTALSSLSYFALRAWITRFTTPSTLQRIIEKCQFCVAIFLSIQLIALLPNIILDLDAAIFSLVLLILTYDQIKASRDTAWHKTIIVITTISLALINTLLAFWSESFILQTSSLLVCISLLWFAQFMATLSAGNNLNKLIPVAGIIINTLLLASQLITYIQLGNWVVIGLIGITMIVSGSLFERYGMSLLPISKKED